MGSYRHILYIYLTNTIIVGLSVSLCVAFFWNFGRFGGHMTKSDPTDVQVNILEKTKKKKFGKNFSFLGNGNVLMEKTKKKRKKNWQKFLIFRKRECAYGKNEKKTKKKLAKISHF